MNKTVAPTLDGQTIHDFKRDGAVHLSGVFTDWLEVLARGVEFNIQHPNESALKRRAMRAFFLKIFAVGNAFRSMKILSEIHRWRLSVHS